MRTRRYLLKLDSKGRCEAVDGKGFVAPPKPSKPSYVLYAMRIGSQLLYVGEAGRGFYRCLQGFTLPPSQSAAYSWRQDNDVKNQEIECLVFDGFQPYGLLKSGPVRKAVEADISFEVRSRTGCWPTKLSSLNVHGKIERTSELLSCSRSVSSELKARGWI